MLLVVNFGFAQQSLKSLLINHGAPSCGSSSGEQQLFIGTTGTPSLIQTCNNGIPFYSVYTAYNPADQKIYFANIGNGSDTRVYALDYNLTGNIVCPTASTPTYTDIKNTIEQFCFDKDGNNIAISNYNASLGRATIRQLELTTGNPIGGTTQTLTFPSANKPNSLSWGDISYLPNGRIFMTFGNTPSKLYELINYDMTGPATAVFLTNIPRPCYSIGYVDGNLFIAGSDGSGCYYYTWDINNAALSTVKPFPLGKTTADITHMNAGVGCAKELIGSSVVSPNVSDIVYHINLKNKGNIDLANVQLKDDLAQVFGAANVSNVSISFVTNPANLILNPGYNGVSDINLLTPGQTIANFPTTVDSVVIRLQLRASNLIGGQIYLNSAVASGQVGAGTNLLQVSDSSNNGNHTKIDLDKNGISDDAGENVPTPYVYNILLASSALNFTAILNNDNIKLSWKNNNETNVASYELQRSTDGSVFHKIKSINPSNNTANYTFTDNISDLGTSVLYYRLRVIEQNGKTSFSNIATVKIGGYSIDVKTFPNPFVDKINTTINSTYQGEAEIILHDASGRILRRTVTDIKKGENIITIADLKQLQKGIYVLEVIQQNNRSRTKIIK